MSETPKCQECGWDLCYNNSCCYIPNCEYGRSPEVKRDTEEFDEDEGDTSLFAEIYNSMSYKAQEAE